MARDGEAQQGLGIKSAKAKVEMESNIIAENSSVGGTWMHKRVPRPSDKDKSSRRRRLLAWTTMFGKERYQRRYFEVQAKLKRIAYFKHDPTHRPDGASTPAGTIEFSQIVRCTRGQYDPGNISSLEDGAQPPLEVALASPALPFSGGSARNSFERRRRASLPNTLPSSESAPTKWIFNLHCRNGRVFTMCTDSESTLDQWMLLLLSETQYSYVKGKEFQNDIENAGEGKPTVREPDQLSGVRGLRPRLGAVATVINESDGNTTLDQRTVPFKDYSVKQVLLKVIEENIIFMVARKQRDVQAELLDAFEPMNVSGGSVIIHHGDCEIDATFYVVETGKIVVVPKSGNVIESSLKPLKPGSCFGTLSLLHNFKQEESFRAMSDARLWTLNRSKFRRLLTQAQQRRIKKYASFLAAVEVPNLLLLRKSSTQSCRLSDILGADDLEKLSEYLKEETFEPQQTIIRQGDLGDSCFIVEHGKVAVRQARGKGATMSESIVDPMSSYIHSQASALGPGQSFCGNALLDQDPCEASYDAANFCKCLVLCRSDLISLFGDLGAHVAPREKLSNPSLELGSQTSSGLLSASGASSIPPPLLVTVPRLENLKLIRKIGFGTFGPVKWVHHEDSGRSFALKCMLKQRVVEKNMQEYVLNERRILQQIESNFVINIYGTLKDERYIYFLLDFLPGQDIYFYLYEHPSSHRGNHSPGFNETTVKVFAASIVIALEHLHALRIAHRDLKVENLCLDQRGYIKLVDFGLAKICSSRTYTICGTSEYIAPEVITNEGHGTEVDLWALGVLIYEMFCGKTPFQSVDLMHTYELIICHDYSWASNLHPSDNLRSIVSQLLTDKNLRLDTGRVRGMIGRRTTVRQHPWFDEVDWDALEKQKLPEAPFIIPETPVIAAAGYCDLPSATEGSAGQRCVTWNPEFS